jgi:hypothetical protein
MHEYDLQKLTTPQDRESRLPGWARDELRELRAALMLADRAAGDFAADPARADSDTFIDPYSTRPVPLGKGTSIRFSSEPGVPDSSNIWTSVFDVRMINDPDRSLSAPRSGLMLSAGRALQFHPLASNTALVTCDDLRYPQFPPVLRGANLRD